MSPGPILQAINAWSHVEPLSTIIYTIYWSLTLFFVTPVCMAILVLRGLHRLWTWLTKRGERHYYEPRKGSSTKLAIFITGCDTGFGREVALVAASKGFVVFAGCLRQESFAQFQDIPQITPLQVDVTSDYQVSEAAKVVQEWIQAGDKEKRVLHAVFNNAGIGICGQVDWLPLSAFQKVMDVNYFGIIRVCHAFTPLLKQQAIDQTHTGARILNMVSMAGLVPSGSGLGTYGPSKFAATSLSLVLRHELKAFGIQVGTINPSFHGTPIVNEMRNDLTKTWNALDEAMREQYGQEFFERCLVIGTDLPQALSWKLDVVVDAVMDAFESQYMEPQILVGMDARFGLVLLRMLPMWMLDFLDSAFGRPIPAAMKAK